MITLRKPKTRLMSRLRCETGAVASNRRAGTGVVPAGLPEYRRNVGPGFQLLKGAADLRKDVARVRSDQANGAHHDDKDHRQHHRVLGDVLTLFIQPKIAK